jgi:hypothetical protein
MTEHKLASYVFMALVIGLFLFAIIVGSLGLAGCLGP